MSRSQYAPKNNLCLNKYLCLQSYASSPRLVRASRMAIEITSESLAGAQPERDGRLQGKSAGGGV